MKEKQIIFLGDSITEGYGASAYQNCYVAQFEAESGAKVYNFGIGGTRIAPQIHPENPNWDRYFALRISEMPKTADIVFIFGGTNDYGHGDAPFGTLSDTTEATFCGAFRVLLRKIKEKYPAARHIVITPLHRRNEVREAAETVKRLSDYVVAIKRIAEDEGAEIIDAYNTFDMPAAEDDASEVWFMDGLHPNDKGHRRIAEKLLSYLEK